MELKWTENPAWGKAEDAVRFACPVTGIEANGRHGGFAALRGCGCVFSERALREVPTDECLQCRQPFSRETDIMPLNPPPEVAAQMLAEWKARAKAQRKSKKSSKKRTESQATAQATSTQTTPASTEAVPDNKTQTESAEMKAVVNGTKRKQSGGNDGEKMKAKKQVEEKRKEPKLGAEPVAKKPRTATPSSTTPNPQDSILKKMSENVYSSIFRSGNKRSDKPITFTHYG